MCHNTYSMDRMTMTNGLGLDRLYSRHIQLRFFIWEENQKNQSQVLSVIFQINSKE